MHSVWSGTMLADCPTKLMAIHEHYDLGTWRTWIKFDTTSRIKRGSIIHNLTISLILAITLVKTDLDLILVQN